MQKPFRPCRYGLATRPCDSPARLCLVCTLSHRQLDFCTCCTRFKRCQQLFASRAACTALVALPGDVTHRKDRLLALAVSEGWCSAVQLMLASSDQGGETQCRQSFHVLKGQASLLEQWCRAVGPEPSDSPVSHAWRRASHMAAAGRASSPGTLLKDQEAHKHQPQPSKHIAVRQNSAQMSGKPRALSGWVPGREARAALSAWARWLIRLAQAVYRRPRQRCRRQQCCSGSF